MPGERGDFGLGVQVDVGVDDGEEEGGIFFSCHDLEGGRVAELIGGGGDDGGGEGGTY